MISDVGKMALLGIVLLIGGVISTIGCLALLDGNAQAAGVLAIGTGLIGTVAGYLTGNGVNAKRGDAPSPVWVPSHDKVVKVAAELAAESPSEPTDADKLEAP